MEIVSLPLPAQRRQPAARFSQPEVELIACNDRKSSLEPFSHMQFHSENSHCCFSAGDLESTAKANLVVVLKRKQQYKTKSLTS